MNDNFLTPQGRQRRSHILDLAIHESRRRRRRRWILPASGAVVVLTVISIVSVRVGHPKTTVPEGPQPIARTAPAESTPGVAVEYLQTDPTITTRLSGPPTQPHWTTVSDSELLQDLADAGQPAGLVTMNGKTILLTAGNVR